MTRSKPAGLGDFGAPNDGSAEFVESLHSDPIGDGGERSDNDTGDNDEFVATAATIGVVGVGVVIFEAALLPGLILGVAATLAPKFLPKIGGALNPLLRSTVRGAYRFGAKAREMAAEVQEQVHDVVAEVKAESNAKVDGREDRDRSTAAPGA
jgi:hypothetical protein